MAITIDNHPQVPVGIGSNLPSEDEKGLRFVQHFIDKRAQANHKRPFASIPLSLNLADGYRNVSYKDFAQAIDRCAWWIMDQIGTSDCFESVIYIGPHDLRYSIFIMAAAKTGYVPLLVSPRNSVEAQLNIVDSAQVSKIMITNSPALESLIAPVLQQRKLDKWTVPDLSYFLEDVPVKPIAFAPPYDEYRLKPLLRLHTSGSTGLPKTITIPYGHQSKYETSELPLSGELVFDRLKETRMFFAFPPFHIAGLQGCLFLPVFLDATAIFPPPLPPSPEMTNSVHFHARPDVSCLPSVFIMALAKNPEHLGNLKQLKSLYFSGGPLVKQVGDELCKHVNIDSLYGSTEASGPLLIRKAPELWQWLYFDTKCCGLEFRPVSGTGLYEMVWVRGSEPNLIQPVFLVFPDLQEFSSKDLFSKHPTEPGLWNYEGRIDDIIVFTTGEKVNPVDMEGIISNCPEVTGALIVGQSRFQTALFVEVKTPPSTAEEKTALLEQIWSYVEIANNGCPHYAKISRDLIAIINPDKYFPRAGKGSIMRALSVQILRDETERLYTCYETRQEPPLLSSIDFTDVDAVTDFLLKWLSAESRISDLSPQTDLFAAGLDSLETSKLVRHINNARSGQEIEPKQIYDHPTIESLAASIANPVMYLNGSKGDDKVLGRMQTVFDDLKASLKSLKSERNQTESYNNGTHNTFHVILTGSTGSLGSYLLDRLMADSRVSHITCLNRSSDASKRQAAHHKIRGLNTDFSSNEVEFLTCNLTASNLGLDSAKYQSLLQSATHIVHNAWTVDFNRHFTSFEPQIRGVRNLIEFVYGTSNSARLFYMSSVSAVAQWDVTPDAAIKVPEVVVEDWNLAKMGYGQSKLVSERLISETALQYGIVAAICRIGQIGGPVLKGTQGQWNQAEWVPSLVLSSKTMGLFPSSLGVMNTVDWLPVDLVAQTCLELLFDEDGLTSKPSNKNEVRVWHVANPQVTTWSLLVPTFMNAMSGTIKQVSGEKWLEELEVLSKQSTVDVQMLPAAKLLSFFQDLSKSAGSTSDVPAALMDTKETVKHSNTLANVQPVGADWVDLWVKQWQL